MPSNVSNHNIMSITIPIISPEIMFLPDYFELRRISTYRSVRASGALLSTLIPLDATNICVTI